MYIYASDARKQIHLRVHILFVKEGEQFMLCHLQLLMQVMLSGTPIYNPPGMCAISAR